MKEETKEHMIIRFLNRETSEEENRELEQWLTGNEENQRYFDQVNELFQVSKMGKIHERIDVDTAWNKLRTRSLSNENEKGKTLVLKRSELLLWKAVASIAILIAIGAGVLWSSEHLGLKSQEMVTFWAPKGEKSMVTLPDGTEVWLNSGSKLEYSTSFSRKRRKVRLVGEGYFSVKKDPEHPFFIDAAAMEVEVLGTRFNLSAYEDDYTVKTTLEEGSVKLCFNDGKHMFLKPGYQAVFDKNYRKIEVVKVDTEIYTSWKENRLRFDNAPFDEVVRKMERWYDVRIILDPELKYSERYTMTIKTESLREMLQLLKITTPMQWRVEEEKVYISPIK